jgi:AAHS family 4-hydroxybenzoate transporter-like MFS transporter
MQLNVSEVIDRSPVGAFQIRVVFLCALVALLDGLDIQAMALVTPVVAGVWGLAPSDFSWVISGFFAGLMAGALVGGLAGDKLGRRTVLIAAFLLVGMTSIATAFTTNTDQLLIARLLTGFGIGSCMPNFTALTAEYVPTKRVGLFVTVMYSAVPLGGVMGGYLAPPLIAAFGWPAVFVAGGILPLVIAVLLIVLLPESIRFLVNKGGSEAKVGAYLAKIDTSYTYDPTHSFVVNRPPKGGSLPLLFSDGRTVVTLVLWMVFFFSLFGMYLLVSWLPSVFAAQGWPRAQAIQSASNFQLGGIAGGILLGYLIDRYGPYPVLAPAFLAASLLTAAIGFVTGGLGMTMVIIALSGFAIVGAQLGMTALAANIYPTMARSTGVGWALGIGRAGAVVSPLAGGWALAAGWDRPALFAGAAVAPFLCAVATLLLWAAAKKHAARPVGATAAE